MIDEKVRDMVRHLLHAIDYDIAKSYDPELSEDPEEAENEFEYLVDIVKSYLEQPLKIKLCEECRTYPVEYDMDICEGCLAYRDHQC